LSGQILQRSLFAAADAIFGAIVTSQTHRNVTSQPKYGQIVNFRLTILIISLFSLCRLRITTQLRSVAVNKMAGIFTKRIWQPCICQPNDLKIKKKTGGQRGRQAKIWGAVAHSGPPLESPLSPLPRTSLLMQLRASVTLKTLSRKNYNCTLKVATS